MNKFKQYLNKVFKLDENKTSIKKEIIAGLTTFLTMSYILGVNPVMLADAGMDMKSVFLATAISAGVASIIMGIVANFPIGLAPGMGLNAFFTYTVVLQYGYTWQEALAATFVSGVIFLILSFTGVRKYVIDVIPKDIKHAIGVGIGFFIAYIGLKNAGIIVASTSNYTGIGNLTSPPVLLAIFGIVLTLILVVRKVPAAVFYGLLGTTVVGLFAGFCGVEMMPVMPDAIISTQLQSETMFAFVEGLGSIFSRGDIVLVLFSFLFVDCFDTAGTLVAIGNRIGLTNEKGEMKDVEKAFAADSVGTVVGAALGTSTVTSFVESSSGVEVGGRTGLSAVTVGILFLFSTLLSPLLAVVNAIEMNGIFVSPITSPALIVVGIMLIEQAKYINWDNFPVATPAFVTIIMMMLTLSIADGIGMGLIAYAIMKFALKQLKDIPLGLWLLIAVFFIHFAIVY